MNPLKHLKEQYANGQLSKAEYIRRMHEVHRILWQYQEFIKDEDLQAIEISQEGVIITSGDGVRIVCDERDTRLAPMDILNFGSYEKDELHAMRRFIKPGAVIVDIGANVGWYCINLSKHAPGARILAFEPIPRTYAYLQQNLQLNKVENVETFPFGLSEREEILEFYYDPELSVAASLRNLHEDRKRELVRCPVKRMDDVLPGLTGRIDLIKCDVEGAEILVLRGGLETIRQTKPVLFLEMLRKWSAKFGYHPNDIIDLLAPLGYRCYAIDGPRLLPTSRVTEETTQTNFIFLDPTVHGEPKHG